MRYNFSKISRQSWKALIQLRSVSFRSIFIPELIEYPLERTALERNKPYLSTNSRCGRPAVARAHRPSPRDDGHFDRATRIITGVAHENRNRGYENSFHTFSRIPEPGFSSYWVTDRRPGVGTGRVNRERDSGVIRRGTILTNELFFPFHVPIQFIGNFSARIYFERNM